MAQRLHFNHHCIYFAMHALINQKIAVEYFKK
jgi:hypothetical protein